jgi:hypothetical protein
MTEIEDASEMTPEQRETLAGQSTIRFFARMEALDISFKNRLGDEITERDRGLALTDMNTFLGNEIISLWAEIEALRLRLGDVGPFDRRNG